MLTQCPGCQTVFRVTGTILRAAHGQVRCGRCNTQFDAIEYLQEEDPANDAASAPAASDGEQVTAEFAPAAYETGAVAHEEITLEGNRIEISGVYRASQPDSEEQAAEHTHTIIEEFNIDTEEWRNPFVTDPDETSAEEAASAEALSQALASLESDEENETAELVADADDDDDLPNPDVEHVAEFDLSTAEPIDVEHTPPSVSAATVTYAAVPEMENLEHAAAAETIEYAAEPEPEPLAVAPQTFHDFIETPQPRRWPWTVASVLLILLLVAQVLHHYRQDLVRHPSFGPPLARLYAMFGHTLEPRWDVAAYNIKQWGIVSDPQAPGTLRVRASITNNANFAQPYPLLKLVLEDRFGANLGTREFKPDEYLPAPAAASRRLTAGTAADVDLAIVDPGDDAVGFQFDVCLPGSSLRCAHDGGS